MLDCVKPSQIETGAETGRPLRILLAGYRSHPYVGGQGVYLRELSRALLALGHEVEVASGPPYPDLDARVRLIRLPSLDLFSEANAFLALRPRHLRRWADISEYLAHNTGAFGEMRAFAWRLNAYLTANPGRYDVIHDNQTLSPPMLRIARRHAPMVVTLHHPISRDLSLALQSAPNAWRRLWVRRWHGFVRTQARVARKTPHILTVSQASKRAAIADFGLRPEQLTVAFNGIDHSLYRPDPDTPFDVGRIVAAASADTPLKGLETLIHAFAIVRAKRPDARLTVLGRLRESPAKAALEAHGLSNAVEFVSGLDPADVAVLYRRAHVLAAPSLFEGFGFPAAEAMACGTPVVVSDGGALPEIVGDGGLVTPKKNPEALAEALLGVLNDPAERARLSTAGRRRAVGAFRWEAHAQAAANLYRQAMADAHYPA